MDVLPYITGELRLLVGWPWNGKSSLDYPDGPSVITRVLKNVRERQKRSWTDVAWEGLSVLLMPLKMTARARWSSCPGGCLPFSWKSFSPLTPSERGRIQTEAFQTTPLVLVCIPVSLLFYDSPSPSPRSRPPTFSGSLEEINSLLTNISFSDTAPWPSLLLSTLLQFGLIEALWCYITDGLCGVLLCFPCLECGHFLNHCLSASPWGRHWTTEAFVFLKIWLNFLSLI